MIRPVHALVASAILAGNLAGQSTPVPRGGPVTIDGRLDDLEWSSARRIEHPDGTVVRLMRDDAHLFVGVTSERRGFVSLCLTSSTDIHVLHASAALGAITYRRIGDTWSSPDTAFVYGMRNRAVDAAAERERAAYLAEHGWVASTVNMNDGRSQEMQIAFSRFPAPLSIAIGRFLIPDAVEPWPPSAGTRDGCFAFRLVSGYVPRGLTFDSSTWLRIDR